MRHLPTPIGSFRQPLPVRDTAAAPALSASAALVVAARALIAETGCTLLLIERTVRPGGVAIRIDAVAADGNRIKGIARSGDPAMRAVCHAANAVLRDLAALGSDAASGGIGLMTDGTGALFSPDRPSVLGDDWLGAVLVGAETTVELAAFDPRGHWAPLAALRHDRTAH